MNIYVDGIFDVFHYGHIESFKKCKELNNNVNLIVGIVNDKVATEYKRQPIYYEKHRYALVESCKYVDKIIKNCPLIINKEFIEQHNIDLVVHGFSNDNDRNNQKKIYEYLISIDKFKEIEYCQEINTSNIIEKIKNSYLQ